MTTVNGYRTGQIASTFGHGAITVDVKDGEKIEAGKVVSLDPTTKELIAYDGTNAFGIAVLDHYENTTLKDCLPQKQATVLLYGVITATKKAGDTFALGDSYEVEADGTLKAGGTNELGRVLSVNDADTILVSWKGF